jgi:hypothetical protein
MIPGFTVIVPLRLFQVRGQIRLQYFDTPRVIVCSTEFVLVVRLSKSLSRSAQEPAMVTNIPCVGGDPRTDDIHKDTFARLRYVNKVGQFVDVCTTIVCVLGESKTVIGLETHFHWLSILKVLSALSCFSHLPSSAESLVSLTTLR